jgi:hypothetical protein
MGQVREGPGKSRISGARQTADPHSIGHSSDGIDPADQRPVPAGRRTDPMTRLVRRARVAAMPIAKLAPVALVLCLVVDRSIRW